MAMSNRYLQSLFAHYGSRNLIGDVAKALEHSGIDVHQITRDDLRALDEFHTRGRRATRAMAEQLGLSHGTSVLDIGCGIGGPARTLAVEFGCRVTGLDIMKDYCIIASLLTDILNLNHGVRFLVGDASYLPFSQESFDVVWSQHVIVNVPHKAQLFQDIRRVLRPSGKYAFFEVCADASHQPFLPVPWASDADTHFPMNADELRTMLSDGFQIVQWEDVTAESLGWFRKTMAAQAARPAGADSILSLRLLMGATTAEKMKNMIRNLEEERIRIVQGMVERKE